MLRASASSVAARASANRRDGPRFVVGEELVALVELVEAIARIAQQRRGDVGAPLGLQVAVRSSSSSSRSGKLLAAAYRGSQLCFAS